MSEDKAPVAAKAPTVYDPAAYNAWIDRQLFPGDKGDAARALARRVKMHEFVMTGGLVIGTNEHGNVTYGPPVDPATTPECPWHGEGCSAWREIVEGRGHGAFDGPSLRDLRERTVEEIEDSIKIDRIEMLTKHHDINRGAAKILSDSEDAFDQKQPFSTQKAFHEARDEEARQNLTEAASSLGDEIDFDGDEDDL